MKSVILSSNGIKYKYKVVDNTSPSYFGSSNRARTGTFGINMDYSKHITYMCIRMIMIMLVYY